MIVLLPCYSLEDFSLHRTDEEADQIFAAWSALYHPTLLELENRLPGWESAGSFSTMRNFSLVVIPPCCETKVSANSLEKLVAAGTILVRHCSTREEVVAEALRLLDARKGVPIPNAPETNTYHEHRLLFDSILPSLSQEVVESFYAAGLAYFVSDLLTRKLRYMSDINTQELEKRLLAAIKVFREEGEEEGNKTLSKVFDLICESTEYYFPSPAKFVDLTWPHEDDLGEPLRAMLLRRRERNEKTSLLLCGPAIDLIEKSFPETIELIREEVAIGRVDLITGDPTEEPLYLLSQAEQLRLISRGFRRIVELFGAEAVAFGRSEAGYSPVLPQILRLCSMENALLFCRDGWKCDIQGQSRLNWKGPNGSIVHTLAKKPIDAERGGEFMRLLDSLGYSWHSDNVLTAVFAHRPGKEAPWWGDVARFNRFAPIFGDVRGLKDYFELTKTAGKTHSLGKDDFRTNFLTRVAKSNLPNPVSRWSTHYRREQEKLSQTIESVIRSHLKAIYPDCWQSFLINPGSEPRLERLWGEPVGTPENDSPIKLVATTGNRLQTLVEIPAYGWIRPVIDPSGKEPESSEDSNEQTSQRQSADSEPAKGGILSRLTRLLRKKSRSRPKRPMAEKVTHHHSRTEVETYYSLKNEILELRIDPSTGAIKRIATFNKGETNFSRGILQSPGRGNRLSWQVIYKLSAEELESDSRDPHSVGYGYSIMTADNIEILSGGPITGAIRISGRLMTPRGTIAAHYQQTISLTRTSSIIDVELQLDPVTLPVEHSWDEYYGCRFIWKDQFAELFVGVHERGWATERNHLQAPEAIHLRSDDDVGVTILSNGNPFFKLHGINRLDSILLPKNEEARSFRFGIGIDLPRPIRSAVNFLSAVASEPREVPSLLLDTIPVVTDTQFAGGETGWLFGRWCQWSDALSNAMIIDAEPVFSGETVASLQLWLLETEGRKTTATLTLADSIESVNVVSPLGENLPEPEDKDESPIRLLDDHSIEIRLKRHQLLPLRVTFRK